MNILRATYNPLEPDTANGLRDKGSTHQAPTQDGRAFIIRKGMAI